MKPLLCHNESSTDALICAALTPISANFGEFMFMPAGVHTITPSQGGKPVQVQVMVDPQSAIELEKQRAAITASGKKPYFDFNHEDREASCWPEAFYWKDTPDPGVYVRGEFSKAGREGIEGKQWRQFSPIFYVNDVRAKPARIVARDYAKPNMGGLVNDPAFKAIAPFFAHDANHSAGAAGQETKQTKNADTMNEQELAALRAKNSELEKELTALRKQQEALKAKNENDAVIAAEIRAKEAELKAGQLEAEMAQTKKDYAEIKAKEAARLDKDIETEIEGAVKRGAIAAKDEETKKQWRELCKAQPASLALLAKLAGNPAIELGRLTTPLSRRPLEASAGTRIESVKTGAREAAEAYGALMAKQGGANSMEEKKQIAKEAGLIYCADLQHNEGFLDLPIQASNSLGTLAGTLVTQRTLELLKLQFPILNRISTDFSDQEAKYNQTVTSRIVGIPTVGTYNTSTGYAQTDETGTDVSVTINAHKYVQTTLNANDLASTLRRLFDEFAPANAYAIAKDLVDAVYALLLNANYSNSTVAALADFGRSSVIDMGTQLNLRGVPQGAMNRTLLLYSTYFGKLAQDPAIVSLAAFQKAEVITDGSLPNVHGFAVADAPNMPDNSENLVGAGFSKSGLVIAGRLPNDYTKALPGASFGNVTVVTNPDSGMSVMQVEYVNHDLGRASQRLAWMYGKAVGQANALQRLTSQ